MARRFVLEPGLSWPEYAIPLESLSSDTIEILTIRPLLMKKYWDMETDSRRPCAAARCFESSHSLATLIRLIRSRWLLVGLKDGTMQLWDVQADTDNEFCASSVGFIGAPDACVIEDDGENIHLTISTTMNYAYGFCLRLPHLGASTHHGGVLIKKTLALHGYFVILGSKDGLLAFAGSLESRDSVIISPRGGRISLTRGANAFSAETARSILMRNDVVVIAKPRCIEIYNPSEIGQALAKSDAEHQLLSVSPTQVLAYPEECLAWKLSFLHPRVTGTTNTDKPPDPIRVAVFTARGFQIHTLELHQPSEGPPEFAWNQLCRMAAMSTAYATSVAWGATGERLAYVGGGPTAREPLALRGVQIPQNLVPFDFYTTDPPSFTFALPEPLGVMSYTCAFDEATGIMATAMTSGRIFVVDTLGIWKPLGDEGTPEASVAEPEPLETSFDTLTLK